MLWNLGRAIMLCMLYARCIQCNEDAEDQALLDEQGTSSGDDHRSTTDNGQSSINDKQSVDDHTTTEGQQSSADNRQSSTDTGQSSISDQQSMDDQSSKDGQQSSGDDQQSMDDDQSLTSDLQSDSDYESSTEDPQPLTDPLTCKTVYNLFTEDIDRFICSLESELLKIMYNTYILHNHGNTQKGCIGTLEKTLHLPKLELQIVIKGCCTDSGHIKVTFMIHHNGKCQTLEQRIYDYMDEYFSPDADSDHTWLLPGKCLSPDWFTQSSFTSTTTSTTSASTSASTLASTSLTTNSHGPDPNSDKSTSCNTDSSNNNSVLSIVIAGVVSFIAGILTTLIFIWLVCSKRRPWLCYQQQPEKTPERMTSDKVTKKILAKHLLSDRKETKAPENKVYFVNEPGLKQGPDDAEGMYNDIDQGGQLQGVYTTIQTSGTTTTSSPPTEEHVYRDLDLDRSVETENNINKLKINDINDNNETQKEDGTVAARYKAETDMFDHARESTVSGHGYFVLQNENFRNSGQPDRTQSGMDPGYADENGGNVDNDYFVLEKQH